MKSEGTEHAEAITVTLEQLQTNSISSATLEAAFGPSSLGIIVIKDLPANFPELRHNLLSYASYLANLPQEQLEKLENPSAKWLVGWSRGRETLKSGTPDMLKGSYYVNCSPSFAETLVQAQLAERYPAFPEYTAANIWPPEEQLPGFAGAFQELCGLIIDVAGLVARACDAYADAQIEGYEAGFLERVVRTSCVTKARLLHYFPGDSEQFGKEVDEDDWCATHVDHGCLTGLTSAMFVDEDAQAPTMAHGFRPLEELAGPPDPKAGLYIHSREGRTVKVAIPRDCLAFQTGEALEVITQGRFKAVPHFVRGAALGIGGRIARNTLAVFTQPNLWEKVDEKRDFAAFAKEVVDRNH